MFEVLLSKITLEHILACAELRFNVIINSLSNPLSYDGIICHVQNNTNLNDTDKTIHNSIIPKTEVRASLSFQIKNMHVLASFSSILQLKIQNETL